MNGPQLDLASIACPNGCRADQGDGPLIRIRGRYGPKKEGVLLYCRKCGKRFAAPRTKPFKRFRQSPDTIADIILRYGAPQGDSIRRIASDLDLDKDTVNRALAEAESHCIPKIEKLMAGLRIPEDEFDRFWRFIQRRRGIAPLQTSPRGRPKH